MPAAPQVSQESPIEVLCRLNAEFKLKPVFHKRHCCLLAKHTSLCFVEFYAPICLTKLMSVGSHNDQTNDKVNPINLQYLKSQIWIFFPQTMTIGFSLISEDKFSVSYFLMYSLSPAKNGENKKIFPFLVWSVMTISHASHSFIRRKLIVWNMLATNMIKFLLSLP